MSHEWIFPEEDSKKMIYKGGMDPLEKVLF